MTLQEMIREKLERDFEAIINASAKILKSDRYARIYITGKIENDRIRDLMDEKELLLREVADALRITTHTLHAYLEGQHEMNFTQAAALAAYLDVEVPDIYFLTVSIE